jgi:hypothetical protein
VSSFLSKCLVSQFFPTLIGADSYTTKESHPVAGLRLSRSSIFSF